MQQSKVEMFRNRLTKVARHLGKQARKMGVTCYRLYDHDIPEFPVCIERYGDMVYVAEYKRNHGLSDEAHAHWLTVTTEVISAVLEVPAAAIFVKLRQRKPGRLGQYEKIDERQQRFAVEENGLTFFVNMTDYLDTGLFLDHRLTRQRIREQAAGKAVYRCNPRVSLKIDEPRQRRRGKDAENDDHHHQFDQREALLTLGHCISLRVSQSKRV